MSGLIDGERVMLAQAPVVKALGPIAALLIQQIHFWAPMGAESDEHAPVVYKTYAQWADELGCSQKQVRTAMNKLNTAGLLVLFHRPGYDRTIRYRVDYQAFEAMFGSPGVRPHIPENTDVPLRANGSAPTGKSTSLKKTRDYQESRSGNARRPLPPPFTGFDHTPAPSETAEAGIAAAREQMMKSSQPEGVSE